MAVIITSMNNVFPNNYTRSFRINWHSEFNLVYDTVCFLALDKPKYLIRLQHALEHQLAMALHRANFTRLCGETTPMYVFMSQSSGQEIKLQGGKTIINYCGKCLSNDNRIIDDCNFLFNVSETPLFVKTKFFYRTFSIYYLISYLIRLTQTGLISMCKSIYCLPVKDSIYKLRISCSILLYLSQLCVFEMEYPISIPRSILGSDFLYVFAQVLFPM